MTGNVVFIGFALAGVAGFSLAASLIALAGFLAGAGLAGLGIQRLGGNRAVLLRDTVAAELVLVGSAAVLATGTAGRSAASRVMRSSPWWQWRSACRTPQFAGSPYRI